MTIIMSVAILIFIIGIIWIWHNLGKIEKSRKVIFIIIGLCIIYLITLGIYKFSSVSIHYPSVEIEKTISTVLIMIFTGLNMLILLPLVASLFDKLLEEELEKSQAKKRIMIIVIIFIACIFIENGYLKSTQEGIINIYNEVQNAEK